MSNRRVPKKMVWETVLGKSIPFEYPLIRHLMDTAAFAGVIVDKVLSKQQLKIIEESFRLGFEDTKKFIMLAAGLHDIGKAHPEWQYNTLGTRDGDPSLQDELNIPESINKDKERWHHDINGGFFFLKNSDLEDNVLKRFLAEITASHHGDFETFKKTLNEDLHRIDQSWINTQKDIEGAVLEALGISGKELGISANKEIFKERDENIFIRNGAIPGLTLITGIVILSDWLASRSDFMFSTEPQLSYSDYYAHAKQQALRHVDEMGLRKQEWNKEVSWGNLFPFSPNELQKSFVDQENVFSTNGLTLINAPMGIGKTEISLYLSSINGAATENSGFWITLPTQATANALFDRAIEIHSKAFTTKENSVALLHSNSSINEAMENKEKRSKRVFTEEFLKHHSKENMDDTHEEGKDSVTGLNKSTVYVSEFLAEKTGGMSSIAVSTIDQMINATTPLKHNMLRWLAISGKTLILDEIHDFDAYTFMLIKKLVGWAGFFKLNIVLMSASLSEKSQRELIDSYVGTDARQEQVRDLGIIPKDGIPSPHWVHVKNVDDDNIGFYQPHKISAQEYPDYELNLVDTVSPVEEIKRIIGENPEASSLVVAHTVNQAISFYREIKNSYDGEVLLLHSRMTETQKQRILKKILSYSGKSSENSPVRKPHILVSTQVVQQSMDIDYDILISILSPLPSFLQRVGRIYRHNQGDRRAEEYRGKPRIHLLVDKGISEWIDNESKDLPKASITPYAEWEIVATLLTLRSYIKDGSFKNVKGDIAFLFSLYYRTEENYKKQEKYLKVFNKALNEEKSKEDQGLQRTLKLPENLRDYMSSLIMTKPYTAKSNLAASTRLIQETEEVCLVIFNKDSNGEDEDWKLITKVDDNGAFTLEKFKASSHGLRKQIGLSSIVVSKYFYVSNLEDGEVAIKGSDPIERIQDNVTFVNVESLEEVLLDNSEGLTFDNIPASKFLWI